MEILGQHLPDNISSMLLSSDREMCILGLNMMIVYLREEGRLQQLYRTIRSHGCNVFYRAVPYWIAHPGHTRAYGWEEGAYDIYIEEWKCSLFMGSSSLFIVKK